MNIEQKIAYLRKALEMGADVQVSFHDARTQEKANEIAAELNELIPQEFVKYASPDSRLRWLTNDSFSLARTTIFFDETNEEATV